MGTGVVPIRSAICIGIPNTIHSSRWGEARRDCDGFATDRSPGQRDTRRGLRGRPAARRTAASRAIRPGSLVIIGVLRRDERMGEQRARSGI